jgi:hypothetical protein
VSLRENLQNFADSVCAAGSDAPDEYAEWSSWTYQTHMADLRQLWTNIRPQLTRDFEKAQWVEVTLQEMFAAFETGQKELGRKAAFAIYNAEVTKLR